jgi:hypothetical protein
MAASSVFTSAKTKGEGLYISLRAVLENPQKTKTKPPGLCMIALTTTQPKVGGATARLTYFKRLRPSTTNVLVRGSITYNGADMHEDYNNWYGPVDGLLVAIKNNSRFLPVESGL